MDERFSSFRVERSPSHLCAKPTSAVSFTPMNGTLQIAGQLKSLGSGSSSAVAISKADDGGVRIHGQSQLGAKPRGGRGGDPRRDQQRWGSATGEVAPAAPNSNQIV
jgi:hypothetical protein